MAQIWTGPLSANMVYKHPRPWLGIKGYNNRPNVTFTRCDFSTMHCTVWETESCSLHKNVFEHSYNYLV